MDARDTGVASITPEAESHELEVQNDMAARILLLLS